MFLGLDVIGNPSQFFKNIDIGIKDLIEETEKGFEKDYAVLGVIGVAVGVKHLLGHVIGIYICYTLHYPFCCLLFPKFLHIQTP